MGKSRTDSQGELRTEGNMRAVGRPPGRSLMEETAGFDRSLARGDWLASGNVRICGSRFRVQLVGLLATRKTVASVVSLHSREPSTARYLPFEMENVAQHDIRLGYLILIAVLGREGDRESVRRLILS